MAQKEVINAIEARLASGWAGADVYGINGTDGDTPEDGTAFVVLQYPYSTARQLTFGAPGFNVWREEGAVRFVIHVERGSGAAQGLNWAAEIAAIFRGKEFDGVQTFAPTSPVVDDANEDGNYYALSFAVPYQFDIVG
ncbi:phage tail terminator-like protein [Aureimonas mangrovi]|uniref:phage tail terminator-like protein n=1 Tax=Aureimonas mangrovi TaxID=2758041 RepID=UPI00163D654D|nr:phage tail terminator-like protein [Aureimonas mangrovi]